MVATSPEALQQLWVNGGYDLDDIVAIYEPDESFIVGPGHVDTGLAAIREAIGNLLVLKPHATLELLSVVRTERIALLMSRWSLTGSNPDGTAADVAGQTSNVPRQQDDTWRFMIDNPWGDAAAVL